MVFIRTMAVNGKKYLYLEKSIRIGKQMLKTSKFLGKQGEVSENTVKEELKKFALEVDERLIKSRENFLKKRILSLEYPLTWDEVRKLEAMNIKYHKIMRSLKKEDVVDVKRRFVANFVFESNAIEGNSLTLKNYTEIIFENMITKGADLREVYDAKNSYETFSWLFKSKKELNEKLILNIHKKIMKNIDSRIGYKSVPNIILGSKVKLSAPENVSADINNLLSWYDENRKNIHPLELAFKFHYKFEKIHPFSDGNGRVGRMLLNYILLREGYFPIIIRKTQRQRYLRALQEADFGRFILLLRFALEKYKETYRKFFEVYYAYAK